MMARIAVIDDEARLIRILGMVLRREGWEVELFDDAEAFCATLTESASWDVVLTDLLMPGVDGLVVLTRVREVMPDVPVVVITAHGTVTTAIQAMRQGAYDYIQKPFDNDALVALVRRALERTQLARENRLLRAAVRSQYGPDNVVAESAAMREVLALARRAARSPATVLVSGDSGTGKELVARAVHYWSGRVGEPFVAVNCKALSAGVLESELFGHEKGAFTGALRSRAGVFERAHRGTLLLDEIGEVDLDFQGKLLRVLQEREVQRVGSDAPRQVDVRVVAATNRDLGARVAEGAFREDLYFRLAVIPIRIPPLRERRDDILPLARHFLRHYGREMRRAIGGWSAELERFLLRHDWPGNVRELENAIERAVVLARGDVLELDDVLVSNPLAEPRAETLQSYLDAATRRRIREVLAEVGGRRAEAAEHLGVDRTTLYRLMKKHGIE